MSRFLGTTTKVRHFLKKNQKNFKKIQKNTCKNDKNIVLYYIECKFVPKNRATMPKIMICKSSEEKNHDI